MVRKRPGCELPASEDGNDYANSALQITVLHLQLLTLFFQTFSGSHNGKAPRPFV